MHSTFRKVFKDRKNVRYIRTVDVKGPIGAALFTLGLVFTLTLIKKSRKQDALKTDVNKLKDELKEAIKKDMEVRNNGTSIAPTLLKLSWNSSATFSRFDQSGGSCGATMRFSPECDWKSNSGLHIARNFLEPFKQKHPSLSYSDLWTLASVVAIESMDGPTIRWQPGRTDATMETLSLPIYAVTESRLPRSNGMSLEDLVANIKETFGRMGRLKYNEIVALCGAHGVGRCHADASGYDGPRTKSETKFSNQYFKVLLNETWTLKTKTKDNKPWLGPAQYENADKTLIMLPSDIALLNSEDFLPYVKQYAEDEALFFKDFATAYAKVIEFGMEDVAEEKNGLLSKVVGLK